MADSSGMTTPTSTLTTRLDLTCPRIADEKLAINPFLVHFQDFGDSANPKLKRWYLTFAASVLVFSAAFSSSAPSTLVPALQQQFGFSEEVGTLTVALWCVVNCLGHQSHSHHQMDWPA
ncbi:hypothetical protein BDN67DRAFT_1017013 [Paxillus ammoniavirescens]|nr:hypothetical protein BDN67DRAFT_1017013 [Paxillus ammoniavirescens]